MYLHFLPFKSKSFNSFISCNNNLVLEKKIGTLQESQDEKSFYHIHGKKHTINNPNDDGMHKRWYKNNDHYKTCGGIYNETMTLKNHKEHSYHDQPSYMFRQAKTWHKCGKQHRDNDKPAYVESGLERKSEWWINGKRHREGDKPAVVVDSYTEKLQEWWIHGKKHRDKNTPAVVRCFTSKSIKMEEEYWVKGQLISKHSIVIENCKEPLIF